MCMKSQLLRQNTYGLLPVLNIDLTIFNIFKLTLENINYNKIKKDYQDNLDKLNNLGHKPQSFLNHTLL